MDGPAPAGSGSDQTAELNEWIESWVPDTEYKIKGDYTCEDTVFVVGERVSLPWHKADFGRTTTDDDAGLKDDYDHLLVSLVGSRMKLPAITGTNSTGVYMEERQAWSGIVFKGCIDSDFIGGFGVIKDTWGDGFYVPDADPTEIGGERQPNLNCNFGNPEKRILVSNNGRQGVGVVGADGCWFYVDVADPARTFFDVEPLPSSCTGVYRCHFDVIVRGDSKLPGWGIAFSCSAQDLADENVIDSLVGIDREARIALKHGGRWELVSANATRVNTPPITVEYASLIVGADVYLPCADQNGGQPKEVDAAINLGPEGYAQVSEGADFGPTPALGSS